VLLVASADILWPEQIGVCDHVSPSHTLQAGRLQTQQITLSILQPGVDVRLVGLPATVHLERPFAAAVSVHNNLDRRLGPLQLSYAALTSGAGDTHWFIHVFARW
jgi:hypothetical protein